MNVSDIRAAEYFARLTSKPDVPFIPMPKFRGTHPRDLRAYHDAIQVAFTGLAARRPKIISHDREIIGGRLVGPESKVYFRHNLIIEYDAQPNSRMYKQRHWQTEAQAYRIQKRWDARYPVERIQRALRLTDMQVGLFRKALTRGSENQ